MKIIICGAGQVGSNIAAFLSEEDNDVTVIDNNPSRIAEINEDYDVNGIVGHASNPDVLSLAGASEADMLIAVTQSDEVNMVACQIGHSLFGVPRKIARIREQSYLQPAWSNLFSRAHMPIDVIISPEVVIAEEIYKRLSVPGTTYVSSLAGGLVHVLGVMCGETCPLLDSSITEVHNLFSELSFKIVAILRKGEPFFPTPDDFLQLNDEVFFIVDTKHLKRTMAAFGHEESQARKIAIFGGGNIGYGLAKLLQPRGRGVHLKIIERNPKRAQFLSENLEHVVVLNGSSLDRDLLKEAGIDQTETAIAITNDDESNILGSLLAKQYGCQRVITLVNNSAYSKLVGTLGIDTIVSPRSSIVGTIMQHVRRGRIKGLHNLREGIAEVIEAEISDISKIVNTSLAELDLPEGVTVAAVVRGEDVIMPQNDFVVREGDHIIVVASHEEAQNVDNLFSVKVDIF